MGSKIKDCFLIDKTFWQYLSFFYDFIVFVFHQKNHYCLFRNKANHPLHYIICIILCKIRFCTFQYIGIPLIQGNPY